jgi:hypothetical protein
MARKKKTAVETPEKTVAPQKTIKPLPAKKTAAVKATKASTPTITDKCKAVEYKVVFDDGTVLYAEGRHAEVLFKYIGACEADASFYGRFRYDGPPMGIYTKQQWAEFLKTHTPLP